MVKKALRGQNLARIFDFGSRLSSFRAENTSKSLPFRQKNRSLTKISFVQKIQKNNHNGSVSQLEPSDKSYGHFRVYQSSIEYAF